MAKLKRSGRSALVAVTLTLLMVGSSFWADRGIAQSSPSNFGVSGGNVNDITRRFCCSGTLGALVEDNTGVQYILSNNHVLGRSDQAAAGEDISQPGLIDNNCRVPPIVADFTTAPTLNSNVDAAIAELRPGTMNPNGDIEGIGPISSVVAAPAVGMDVAKRGRTTGLTTGTISSINTSVNVQYQRGCGQGKKFVVSFTGQVVVSGSSFSAGGDSGSLIVTNDSCHQPVGLLFAGSSTTTIGNPAGEVITKVSQRLGRTVGFVGDSCSASASSRRGRGGPSQEAVEFATISARGRERDLMSRAGVIGVGVGVRDNNSAETAIVVYVDQSSPARPRLPRLINGVQVKIVYTDPFVAY